MGKLGVLAVGVALIIGVLFIGYKMDSAQPKMPAKKAPKASGKRAKVKEEYVEEIAEEDYDDPYRADMDFEEEVVEDEEEGFFSSGGDMEDEPYEEDMSLFSSTDEVESSFDSDIDNELSFEPADTVQTDIGVTTELSDGDDYEDITDFGTNMVEEMPEEVAVEEVAEEPVIEEVVEEKPKKRGRPKKAAKEPEPVEEVAEDPYDFSSTMVFDTDKLASDLEEIDNMDKAPINNGVDTRLDIFGGFGGAEEVKPEPFVEPEVSESSDDGDEEVDPFDFSATIQELSADDYTEPVYDIDDKIEELDEEPKAKHTEVVDGPFKPAENEAESFMNELKRMQESAEADDFAGFAVETKSEELKETHRKYTKKKEETIMEEPQISFIPEEMPAEEPISSGVDINFLEQMEKNLKETQKERLNKKSSKKDKDE